MRRTRTGRSCRRSALRTLIICYSRSRLFICSRNSVRRTSMFFHRISGRRVGYRSLALQPEDVEFTSSDGVRLHGWFFKAGEPTLIFFHGNAGNIAERGPTAAGLAKRGVSVFVFDWRGYGKSEGRPSESGLFRDALAAYDYTKARTHGTSSRTANRSADRTRRTCRAPKSAMRRHREFVPLACGDRQRARTSRFPSVTRRPFH